MFRATQYNPFNSKQFFYTPSFSALSHVPRICFSSMNSKQNHFFTIGNQHLLNNQFQQALDHYTQCDIFTDSVLNNMGACYAQLKQFDLAAESYQRALTLKSDNFESNYNLACLHYILKNINQANKYFKYAYELNPSHQLARKNYLSTLQILFKEDIDNKRDSSVHEKLDEMIKHEEYFEYGLTEKGRLYLEQHQFAKALQCFREVINVNPEYPESRILYVKTIAAMSKFDNSKSEQPYPLFQLTQSVPESETSLLPPPKP